MTLKNVFVVSEWLANNGRDQELWDRLNDIIFLTKQESGCIRAHVTRQIPHPGSLGTSSYKIVLLQEYENVTDFDAHCRASYVTDFFEGDNGGIDLVSKWTCRLFSEENVVREIRH